MQRVQAQPVWVGPGIGGDPMHWGVQRMSNGEHKPPGAESGTMVVIDREEVWFLPSDLRIAMKLERRI